MASSAMVCGGGGWGARGWTADYSFLHKEGGRSWLCGCLCVSPFSKTLFRSTLTRWMVWPWALWMDMAQASTRGI